MKKSNIIGGSNIYPCKKSPFTDQNFVNQIEDYNYIRVIHKRQEFMQSTVCLTKKQLQLLEIEMRCVYTKNDPCWGYINGQGIRSKCVEGRCPRIMNCNPTYNSEQREYWTMTEEAKALYGRPDKQKKYYLVDLVSDVEMAKYVSDPKGEGIDFPTMSDQKPKNSKKNKHKGRRQVIIGYEETYFGDADNQLSPIWGYVDDSEDIGTITKQHYGSSKKMVHKNTHKVGKNEKSQKESVKFDEKKYVVDEEIKQNAVEELFEEKKLQYEKKVKDKLCISYKLTEITNELIREISSGKVLNIILSNEAEMAYVSSMFMQVNIPYDVELCDGNERVCLWKAQNKSIMFSSTLTLVSSTFVKQGCSFETEIIWSKLGEETDINELVVSGREFFCFEGNNKQKRWGCKGLYGATHIVIKPKDLNLSKTIDKEQRISLVMDNKNYIILLRNTEEQIGVTTEGLWGDLKRLEKLNEILEMPRFIEGLVLKNVSGVFEIKGIGHMKFDEY